jgi:hypothetical protein
MSKNDAAKAKREQIITAIEKYHGGKEMKRCASATAGLSMSNSTRLYNGLAHLLCNPENFPIVEGLLAHNFEVPIPKEYDELGVDTTSYCYACGTSRRYVPGSRKHVSQDDAKSAEKRSELARNFVNWSQANRISIHGGIAGLSRSVARTTEESRADWTDAQKLAAKEQEAVHAVLLDGGERAAKTLMRGGNVLEVSAKIMADLAAAKERREAKLAEKQAEKKGGKKPQKAAPATTDEELVRVFEDIAGAAPLVEDAKASKASKKRPAAKTAADVE